MRLIQTGAHRLRLRVCFPRSRTFFNSISQESPQCETKIQIPKSLPPH
jgi:hypothetical protein